MMNRAAQVLEPFVKQWAILLTTYKRDGTPVGTAVNVVVEGDRAYFRTWSTTGKLKRIRNNPEVEFVPCTPLGRPKGPTVRARARILEGDEAAHARELLAREYPLMHGIVVPLVHRLRGYTTMHIELRPMQAGFRPLARYGAVRDGRTLEDRE
jgi:PPOX class probable F420-dependent enzyme